MADIPRDSFIKICGITSEEDALSAVAMDADAIGFVFAPSRRQVTPQLARDIVRRLPSEVVTIGVFQNDTKEHVVDVWAHVGLTGVQLHGEEPHGDVRWIRQHVPFVVRAFKAGDPSLARAADAPIDAVLIDSPKAGSGKVFDWTLAEGVPGGVRLILAGGLTPDNVQLAIGRVRPWGVDVSTGVEVTGNPGRKDASKMRRFVANAREGFESISRGKRPLTIDLGLAEADVPEDRPYDWAVDGD